MSFDNAQAHNNNERARSDHPVALLIGPKDYI